MLEVGNGGMKRDEYRTHMALWVLLAAPLLAGNDLRNMSPETKELLLNSESWQSIRTRRAYKGIVFGRKGLWKSGEAARRRRHAVGLSIAVNQPLR